MASDQITVTFDGITLPLIQLITKCLLKTALYGYKSNMVKIDFYLIKTKIKPTSGCVAV